MLIKTGVLWGLGVGGVGDWVGVSDWGLVGLIFFKVNSFKNEPNESCEKVVKKFQNLKIWLKFAPGNRQVGGRFSKNPLPAVFLKFFSRTPNFTKLLNP